MIPLCHPELAIENDDNFLSTATLISLVSRGGICGMHTEVFVHFVRGNNFCLHQLLSNKDSDQASSEWINHLW
ncbi:hypothetical protein ZWY2020_028105 [Hordeum vulgare]|nr:hypothetical protein ZWY2020_028105 [Hordeum vulgare]